MRCPSCGFENPETANFCSKCGNALSHIPTAAPEPQASASPPPIPNVPVGQPVSPPPPPLPAPPSQTPLELARLGDRFLALILDMLVVAAVFAVIGMYLAVRWGGLTESGFSLQGGAALAALGLVAVVALLYYWLAEGLFGATLGKAILGIGIVGADDRRCTLKASAIRNALRLIDGLFVYLVGFLVAVFSKYRQRIGDHLAHTRVVEKPVGRLSRITLAVVWLIVIAGGIWWAYQIHSGAPVSLTTSESPKQGEGGLAGGTTTARVETKGVPETRAEVTIPVTVQSGDLTITGFKFLEKEDGPTRAPAAYQPGEKIFTVSEIGRFAVDSNGRASLRFDIVPLDPSGLEVADHWTDSLAQTLKDPKEPITLTYNLRLPPYAPPGPYKLQIRVSDVLDNDQVEVTPGFSVADSGIRPASELEIRGFKISHQEDGPAESNPVFRSGERVYITFQLMGLQFIDNRPDTRVELSVLDPAGDAVLKEPSVVEITDPMRYHPSTLFFTLNFWVGLPSPAAAGKYRIQYKVDDRAAKRTLEPEASFQVQ